MAYELPPLPYDYAALEPHIDTETMKLHHDKHHAAYVNNLNGAIEKHPELAKHSPEDLLRNLGTIPEDIRGVVRNNGGGHVNHTMFWTIMKPNGGGDPTGKIAEQIKKDFGSFADFKKLFNETTAKQFGSGWGWLIFEGGKLKVVTSAKSGQPYFAGAFSHSGKRCLGTRVLPQIPEQAARLPRRLVEYSELGRGQQALRTRPEVNGCPADPISQRLLGDRKNRSILYQVLYQGRLFGPRCFGLTKSAA